MDKIPTFILSLPLIPIAVAVVVILLVRILYHNILSEFLIKKNQPSFWNN